MRVRVGGEGKGREGKKEGTSEEVFKTLLNWLRGVWYGDNKQEQQQQQQQ